MRTSHTVSGQTTSYTWDVAAGLPVVLQDGTNTYVFGVDLISATDGGGVQTYFLTDGLGSTTDLRDGNANSVANYSYDVFGAIRTQGGGSSNYWLFTGEQRDADSAMYYLRARYYDPAVGRFLTQDPIAGDAGNPQTQNRYPYVTNNPVNYSDPSGLEHDFGWAFLGIDPPPGFDCAHLESQDERASCYGEYTDELIEYVIEVLAPAWQEWLALYLNKYRDCMNFAAQAALFGISLAGPQGALASRFALSTTAWVGVAADAASGERDKAAIRGLADSLAWDTYGLKRVNGVLAPYAGAFGLGFGVGTLAMSGLQCVRELRG